MILTSVIGGMENRTLLSFLELTKLISLDISKLVWGSNDLSLSATDEKGELNSDAI